VVRSSLLAWTAFVFMIDMRHSVQRFVHSSLCSLSVSLETYSHGVLESDG